MEKPNFTPYSVKVVESGNTIEIYRFADMHFKKEIEELENVKKENQKKELSANFELKEEEQEQENKKEKKESKNKIDENYKRKESAIFRTKTKLKRLINANVNQYQEKDKFITLTFKEFKTRDEVIYCFKQFNKRLRYNYPNYDYQYIAVIERGQKNTKRLHLHVLFFGLPFIYVYEFRKIWKYGNVDMESLDNYYDIANYVLKYLQKTIEDGSYIGKGQNFYLTSRKLYKPVECFYNDEDLKNYLELHEDKEIIYANEYDSDFLGEYEYYKLRKSSEIHKRMSKEYYLEYLEEIEEERERQEKEKQEFIDIFGVDYETYVNME